MYFPSKISARLRTEYLERKKRVELFYRAVKEGKLRYSQDNVYHDYIRELKQNILKDGKKI